MTTDKTVVQRLRREVAVMVYVAAISGFVVIVTAMTTSPTPWAWRGIDAWFVYGVLFYCCLSVIRVVRWLRRG